MTSTRERPEKRPKLADYLGGSFPKEVSLDLESIALVTLSLRSARALGHFQVGPEHFLLAITQLEENSPAQRIYQEYGVDFDSLSAAFVRITPPDNRVQVRQSVLTERSRATLLKAQQVARTCFREKISPLDILKVINDEDRGNAGRLLRDAVSSKESLDRRVQRMLDKDVKSRLPEILNELLDKLANEDTPESTRGIIGNAIITVGQKLASGPTETPQATKK